MTDEENEAASVALTHWLLGRETEIATDEEDFGELHGLFCVVMGREPEAFNKH